MRTQFGIRYRLLLGKFGQLLKQLLVLLGPVDGGSHAVGAASPQVGHAALKHEDQLVGGGQQAVAQEAATSIVRAGSLILALTDGGLAAMRRA